MFLAAILIFLLVEHSPALDPGCDFVQNVQQGEIYYIYNKEYPNSYKPGSQCRWLVVCPLGYNCQVKCNEVNLPESKSCSMDRLVISRTKDSRPTEYYCGQDNVTAVSVEQTIGVVLNSSVSGPGGGKFLCEVVAQLDTSTNSCACGYSNTKQIGNETQVEKETKPNEYPMMAGIVDIDEKTIKCGAVIISKSYVLTAAHCVKGKNLNQIGVIVGEHDTSRGNDSLATQFFRVQGYKLHPNFTTVTYEYDIAAVKILGEILFSPLVGPVCLPFKFSNYDFNGERVTILGWSKLRSGGETSNDKVLHKVNMNVVSHVTCNHYISTVTPQHVCTYAKGKDNCLGNSGGPVLYTDLKGDLYLVGIVSYGKNCTWTMPGVNTRITSLLEWIVTTAPDNYCVK